MFDRSLVRLSAWCLVLLGLSGTRAVAQAQRACGLDARNRRNVPLPIVRDSAAPESTRQIEQAFDMIEVQNRSEEGKRILQNLLPKAVSGNDLCSQALAQFGLGAAARSSDMAASIGFFQRSQALLERVGTPLALAYVHERIATAKHFTGDKEGFVKDDPAVQAELHEAGDEAGAIYEKSQALQWAETAQRPDEQAALLRDLDALDVPNKTAVRGFVEWNAGSSLRRSGRFAEIVPHFNAALAAFNECDCEQSSRAAVLLTLASASGGAGDGASELDYAQQGDAIYRKYHLETLRPQSLRLIAGAYAKLGDYPRAIATFEEGLRIARETHSLAAVANLGLEEATALGDSGQPLKGLQLIAATVGDKPSPNERCATVAERMTLESQLGRYAEAKVDAGVALGECRALLLPGDAARLMSQAADNELKQGHPQEALAQAQGAIEIIDSQRGRVQPVDRALRAFNEQQTAAYNQLIGSYVKLNRPEDALLASEQFRARSFVDLARTRGTAAADKTPPVPASAGRSRAQDLPSEARPFALTMADIRQSLEGQHSTLISYWVAGDGELYTWVLSPGKPVFQNVRAVDGALLASLVKASLPGEAAGAQGLNVTTRGGRSQSLTLASRKPWRDLYNLLIAPIADQLPQQNGSLLTIVPQGQLFQVSFPALVDPAGHYLVERYAVSTVPSAGALQITAKNDSVAAGLPQRYLLLANPQSFPSVDGRPLPALPGTGTELQGISHELAGKQVTLLQGKDAGIDSLIRSLPQATVVHMATHAVVSDTAPLTSFLALDRGQRGGLLTAASVYDLHLNASLVVLSACSTGRGQITGDGVAGLSRAFFYAGAASLVTTLWDVVDEPTAELMTRYYGALARGESRSGALRTAQLSVIADLRRHRIKVPTLAGTPVSLPENPAFWAAFTLSGQP